MEKKILDVTCGARTIWFNKNHPAAIYCDRRHESYQEIWKSAGDCRLDINPDIQCDFTALPFQNNKFHLVIFDPPHLSRAKETSWLVKKYGKLDNKWPQMLHDGFDECMRVLIPDGVLIFKWSEHDIPAEKVWSAIGEKPLFGHHSGKASKTFWACFMKFSQMGRDSEETMDVEILRALAAAANSLRFNPAIDLDEAWNYQQILTNLRVELGRENVPSNDPLTLEQLREMDGESVWICDPDGTNGMWALVDLEYELCRTAKGGIAIFDTYGKNWLAYRRKPEEGV